MTWHVPKTAGVSAYFGSCWNLGVAGHHGEGLVIVEIPAGGSGGQTRVIDENSISSDHDRIVFGAILVNLLPCCRARNPLACAISSRGTTVPGHCPFECDPGSARGDRVMPALDER